MLSKLGTSTREKALEERDNKPVSEFDFEKYVRKQIRLLDDKQISVAEFTGSMLTLECLVEDFNSANAEIAELLARSKQIELVRSRCKMQMRKLMQ